jgi:preprotein translocase subunit SecA
MLGAMLRKAFGSANDRRLKTYRSRVAAVNELEDEVAKLSDEDLRARTQMFRERLAAGETLDDILAPAFATVREAAKRTLGQRHFDVQLIGGIVLHEGAIAEMRTGEGKTLVATLATYLNALAGKGVHVVTVNDYLAKRDSEWMGRVYQFLGLSVGVIVHGLDDEERRQAYASDVTYGTNNEFGFDYLRDNMKYELGQMVQRGHAFAIVDEVDSILVDEARTPLIISGPSDDKSELYNSVDKLIPKLVPQDYEVDEKQRTVHLTEVGNEHMESLLGEAGLLPEGALYDAANVTIVHHVQQALKAHTLFQRDKDYIVRNDEIVIIDEFTGRMMPGRRFSEGLHQGLEAKEHVAVQPENVTLASITFQNYFRLYKKLAGMTGTASTEADEFGEIYNLDVVEIPTNRPVCRLDEDDEVYRTHAEKLRAVLREITQANENMQPLLVGTTSIEKSEQLAEFMLQNGYRQIDFADPAALAPLYAAARAGKQSKLFAVLNARFHEQEAYIVAEAGVPGAITIATNMAGRGTDIQLGGNVDMRVEQELAGLEPGPDKDARETAIRAEIADFKEKARSAGGLYIIGTERHESRRIDNQLRGRSGRQGDPGRSKFFLSLQDDLMRIFGSDRIDSMLQRLGMQEDEAIIHSMINRAIAKAQQKVEARNFDIRKNILKYDNVMNDQRKVVFEQRREMMAQDSLEETVANMRGNVVDEIVSRNIPKDAYPDAWNIEGLEAQTREILNVPAPITDWAKEEGIADEEIRERLEKAADEAYAARVEKNTPDVSRYVEKQVVLQVLDHFWREHLVMLDHLRQVIGWRGYAQRDPLNEYKSEAFELFNSLISRWHEATTAQLMRVEIAFEQPSGQDGAFAMQQPFQTGGDDDAALAEINARIMAGYFTPSSLSPTIGGGAAVLDSKPARNPKDPSSWGRVSRNEPCPCGSGRKYKHCHGALA